MKKKLFKKLLLNALNDLIDRYSTEGCDDLLPGDPMLEGISKSELKEVELLWRKYFPKESAELLEDLEGEEQEIPFTYCIVDVLEKVVKKL